MLTTFPWNRPGPEDEVPRMEDICVGDIYYHARMRTDMQVISLPASPRSTTIKMRVVTGVRNYPAGFLYSAALHWLRVIDPLKDLDIGEDEGC